MVGFQCTWFLERAPVKLSIITSSTKTFTSSERITNTIVWCYPAISTTSIIVTISNQETGCISDWAQFPLQPFYLSANLFCLCKGGPASRHASGVCAKETAIAFKQAVCTALYIVHTVHISMLLFSTLGYVSTKTG